MAGQSPTSQPFPDEAIALAHGIATRHVRSDRFASLVWAVVFGIGFLVFLGLCVGGSFTGHDAVIGEVVLGVLIAFLLYATLHGLVQETRTLASLEAPPRQLRLTSERLRRSSSDRRVGLHEGSSVIGTARIRRTRPLTSLSVRSKYSSSAQRHPANAWSVSIHATAWSPHASSSATEADNCAMGEPDQGRNHGQCFT
jgi:hypothetical protein